MAGGKTRGVARLTAEDVAAWLAQPGPGLATRKLADGGGLYLVRLPSGSASWQIKYRFRSQDPQRLGQLVERTYSVGPQATTSLEQAREAHRNVRDQLRQGIDPVRARETARTAAKAPKIEARPVARVERIRPAKRTTLRPALLTFAELGDVLRRAEVAHISPGVRLAHRLTAFSVAHVTNVMAARWMDFALDSVVPTWRIRGGPGKGHDQLVVLPDQIAREMRAWRDATGTQGGFAFPGNQGREHLSREALEKALRVTLGLADRHSPQAWRVSFAHLASDSGQFDPQTIDVTLDRIRDSGLLRAHEHGELMVRRIELMMWWGLQLEHAQAFGADPAPLKRRAA